MKKMTLAVAVIISILFAASVAQASMGQFTYIGTVNASKVFAGPDFANTDDWGLGLGTYHMIDYQGAPFLAIGLGFGLYSYSLDGGGSVKLSAADIAGRILPVSDKPGRGILPYLVGGAGINPLETSLDDHWTGSFNAFAGAGMRYDFDKQPGGSGLDLQVVYEFNTPMDANLNAAALRLGYSVGFGGKKGEAAQAIATAVATPVQAAEAAVAQVVTPVAAQAEQAVAQAQSAVQTPVQQAAAQVQQAASQVQETAAQAQIPAGTYTVVEGDTLWRIACRNSVYGDCELYPLLVLANTDILKTPDDLKPGMVIKVNRDVSETLKARARASAWREDYVRWRGSRVTKSRYEEWKAKRQQQ